MIEWSDRGIVLSARPHGEGSAVVSLLTAAHGRHAGLVRGATGPKGRGVFQPGNSVAATWRARLAEHLGTWSCELDTGYAAAVLDDPLRLAGLAAVCAVADATLPEREPHPALHDALEALLQVMTQDALGDAWIAVFVRWELGLLAELGYGLDLSTCAATGANDDLAYVSPRSGRAVSLAAGEPYRDKLLPLPRFLVGEAGSRGGGDADDLLAGLTLTGFFLDRHAFAVHNRPLPPARARFVDRVAEQATVSGGGL
jgi:DNA repair protein RecO (recombination protein O)